MMTEINGDIGRTSGNRNVSGLFEQEEKFIILGIGVGGSEEKTTQANINTLQINDDGTVTYACYKVKQSVLESE